MSLAVLLDEVLQERYDDTDRYEKHAIHTPETLVIYHEAAPDIGLESAKDFQETAEQLRQTTRPPQANLPEHASTLMYCNLPQPFEVVAGKLNLSLDESSKYRNILTKDHVPDYSSEPMPAGVNASAIAKKLAPGRVVITRGFV
jgi:hypothetical protein